MAYLHLHPRRQEPLALWYQVLLILRKSSICHYLLELQVLCFELVDLRLEILKLFLKTFLIFTKGL